MIGSRIQPVDVQWPKDSMVQIAAANPERTRLVAQVQTTQAELRTAIGTLNTAIASSGDVAAKLADVRCALDAYYQARDVLYQNFKATNKQLTTMLITAPELGLINDLASAMNTLQEIPEGSTTHITAIRDQLKAVAERGSALDAGLESDETVSDKLMYIEATVKALNTLLASQIRVEEPAAPVESPSGEMLAADPEPNVSAEESPPATDDIASDEGEESPPLGVPVPVIPNDRARWQEETLWWQTRRFASRLELVPAFSLGLDFRAQEGMQPVSDREYICEGDICTGSYGWRAAVEMPTRMFGVGAELAVRPKTMPLNEGRMMVGVSARVATSLYRVPIFVQPFDEDADGFHFGRLESTDRRPLQTSLSVFWGGEGLLLRPRPHSHRYTPTMLAVSPESESEKKPIFTEPLVLGGRLYLGASRVQIAASGTILSDTAPDLGLEVYLRLPKQTHAINAPNVPARISYAPTFFLRMDFIPDFDDLDGAHTIVTEFGLKTEF